MGRYVVRNVRSDDFDALMSLEETLFGTDDDGVLGPYYVRLCCEFFADSCFVVEVEGRLAGYLLSFLRNREAYCTTLAILPAFQGTRAVVQLIRAFTSSVVDHVDACWFTVEESNSAARALHEVLGAKELEVRPDFYGRGRSRIVSRVDREAFRTVRGRLERLGLVQPASVHLGASIPAQMGASLSASKTAPMSGMSVGAGASPPSSPIPALTREASL